MSPSANATPATGILSGWNGWLRGLVVVWGWVVEKEGADSGSKTSREQLPGLPAQDSLDDGPHWDPNG